MLTIIVFIVLIFYLFKSACKGHASVFVVAVALLLLLFSWFGINMTEPEWFFPEEEPLIETAELVNLTRLKVVNEPETIYSAEKLPSYFNLWYKKEGNFLKSEKYSLREGKDIFIVYDPAAKKATLSIITKSKKPLLNWWVFPRLLHSEKTFHVVLPEKYRVE